MPQTHGNLLHSSHTAHTSLIHNSCPSCDGLVVTKIQCHLWRHVNPITVLPPTCNSDTASICGLLPCALFEQTPLLQTGKDPRGRESRVQSPHSHPCTSRTTWSRGTYSGYCNIRNVEYVRATPTQPNTPTMGCVNNDGTLAAR